MRTPDGVTGFPAGLWARQSTEIRPTNRLAHLDVHATAQYDRVMNEGGSDVITTVYLGEAAGQVPDHRPDRLDGLVDRSTANRRKGDHLHAHPGGLHRGQHHLTEHLRANGVFIRLS